MSSKPDIITTSGKPTYQILGWLGGGGFGQVFKVKRKNRIVACKQIHIEDFRTALDEYKHMTHLRSGPHIAVLHEGMEYNTSTGILSFFMEYYRGKDLNRQIQMLRGANKRFSEIQIISIGIQIAEALYYCHSMNVLHQDMKPHNVLLRKNWNPLTQADVPELFVADFGISSRVQNMQTRLTGNRGTPGYQAPEIRQRGRAAFSEKSDVYAFGCVLYQLITLRRPDPSIVDDIAPRAIARDRSFDLVSLVSAMLSSERFERPTASDVMSDLIAMNNLPKGRVELDDEFNDYSEEYDLLDAETVSNDYSEEYDLLDAETVSNDPTEAYGSPGGDDDSSDPQEAHNLSDDGDGYKDERYAWNEPAKVLRKPVCLLCGQIFASLTSLRKHRNKTGHLDDEPLPRIKSESPRNESRRANDKGQDFNTPTILTPRYAHQHPSDRWADEEDHTDISYSESVLEDHCVDIADPSPCVVCLQRFNTKQKFYKHLHGCQHYRSPGFVRKRRAEIKVDASARKRLRVNDKY